VWSASQQQTLSGTCARVYTAHRGWLGVVTGISAASTGGVLVLAKSIHVSRLGFYNQSFTFNKDRYA